MNEHVYLSKAESARSQAEHWRLKIEQDKKESELRLQNFDTEIKHEKEMTETRQKEYRSHIENAKRDEDQPAIDSWTTLMQNEDRELNERLERIARSIEDEKRQIDMRIREYETERQKSIREIEKNIKMAASIKHGKDERQKQIYALDLIERLTR